MTARPLARVAGSRARERAALALLFVTPALWAMNYYVARKAPGVVAPHLLAFLRWTIALGIMLPIAWSELYAKWPQWRREWPDLLALGALGMWICGAFVYIGGRTTSATNIGLLYAVSPVLVAALSSRLFADRLTGLQKAGVAIALAGVLLIVLKGRPESLLAVAFTVGDLWVLAAVLAWTAYSILLRLRPTVLDPFARLSAITMGGILVLAPFTAVECWTQGLPADGAAALWLAIIAAVLPGFGAYQAYSFMQRELGPSRTALVLYLGPLYAAGMAWLLLDEMPQWFHAAGAALILPGIWLATRATPVPGASGTPAVIALSADDTPPAPNPPSARGRE